MYKQINVVMHRYEILPTFRLTDIAFLTLANTDNQSDINIAFRSANNRYHYAMKLSLNMSEHSILNYSTPFHQN